jgi:outer membrane autotransporter protein
MVQSTAIYNTGQIGSLTNSGVVTTNSDFGAGINNLGGSIGTLSNSGSIGGGQYGVANSSGGTISELDNTAGVIHGGGTGIYNTGTIGSLTNTNVGSITGSITGGNVGILNLGAITSLTNGGWINGNQDGINNNPSGTIGTLINAQGGSITSAQTGLYNNGQIGSLTNNGVISATNWVGILNDLTGSISNLINAGQISGGTTGILNIGMISSLNNSGEITGALTGNGYGIVNTPTGGEGGPGLINLLTNSGLIGGSVNGINNSGSIGALINANTGHIEAVSTGLYNSGQIGSLTNSGLIGGEQGIGISNHTGTIEALVNLSGGTITGGETGVYNDESSLIGRLTNNGMIMGGFSGVSNTGSIGTLSNTGVITGGKYGVDNEAVIDSLYNNGTISATNAKERTFGVSNDALITSLTNDRLGTISGGTGIYSSGTIGTLTNAGAILAIQTGIVNDGGTIGALSNSGNIVADYGIDNNGSIGSLVNSGTISSRSTGLSNYITISTLVNSGKITGASDGIYSVGLITSLTNRGLISGGSTGVNNQYGGSISTLSNSGTISGTEDAGIWNDGTIASLGNTGHITGATAGISNFRGTIGALINSGTIEATGKMGDGVYNGDSITGLTNSGLIQGTRSGVYNAAGDVPLVLPNFQPLGKGAAALITTLINSSPGTIAGTETGLYNAGLIGAVINSGVISGGGIGVNDDTAGSIVAVVNSGTVTGGKFGLVNSGSLGSLTNTGTIKGASKTGIENSGTIGTVANSGLISAPTAINVTESGSMGLLTNSGKVAGNIVNASANDLSIAGGSGGVFGTLTGFSGGLGVSDIGQITNTASNVAFTAGNVVLNDHVNVGTGTVSNAATLQVDNAIDIKGNYLQTSAGTLSVGVASLAKHGELEVSSAAAVNGDGHVALTQLDGFRFAAGESFTVIEAGSATYNVASLSAAAAGFSGGYLVNAVQSGGQSDLVVCLTNLVKANCNGGIAYTNATTSNAISANNAAGGYFGSNVALNKLADAVVTLGTSPAANRAGNQLSADPHNNASVLATQPSLDVLNVVTGHADSTRLAANGGGSGVSAGESGPGLATWGEAFGGGAHQSEDGQYSGYSMSSEGIVAGGDAAVADSNVRVGGVFAYTHADLNEHGDRTGDTLSLDSYGVLGYGSLIGEHAYVDLLGGVLFDKFDTVRVVSFTNFSGVASGTHDGTQYVAKAAGGYRLPMGESGTTLTPIWGLTYSHLNQDSYTESGGNGAALHVNSLGDNSLKGEAGLKLEHSFAMAHGDVVPEVRAMYRHEFDSGAQVQTASFAADENASFSTLDARPIVNSGVFSTGVNFLGKDGMTVTLRYTAEAATGYVSQGGSLRVRWSF